jgi:hypothetical protein
MSVDQQEGRKTIVTVASGEGRETSEERVNCHAYNHKPSGNTSVDRKVDVSVKVRGRPRQK